jgi:ribose transport system permease protein
MDGPSASRAGATIARAIARTHADGVPPYLLATAVALLLCAINFALQPTFFALTSVAATLTAALPMMMIASGQTYVVIGGSIDLSLGAIVSLVNVIVVVLAERLGGTQGALAAGLFAGVVCGTLCGAINGAVISFFRIEPIVVTFASGIVYGGLALMVLPQAGGSLREGFAEVYGGDIGGVPVVLFVFAGLVVFCRIVRSTLLYAHLVALGSNPQGAFKNGLRVALLRIASHAMGGMLASAAAVSILGVAAAGDPLMGQAFTLGSVSAVVLGGTALSGGWGGTTGSLLGAAILTLINNVIFFAQLDYRYQGIVQGLIVLVALAGGVLTSRPRT